MKRQSLVNKPRHHLANKAGLPPESLIYTGLKAMPTAFSLLKYDQDSFSYQEGITARQAIDSIEDDKSNWLVVVGFEDAASIELIAEKFGINPLILEDIFNVQHLPKVEDTGSSLFITLKNLHYLESNPEIQIEQISMFLGGNILITFQEKESSIFNPIIERLKAGKGKGRVKQEDYLAYLLVDHIVDQYYLLIDTLEDQIQQMEELLLKSPANELSMHFLNFKKSLILLRRAIYPLKDEIRYIAREESELITANTRNHLNDVHDHLSQIIQSLDNYREIVSAMMDLQLANNSNRMNSIMKTLTLVSTIFIPLTFAVGIYGMNFKYMPELEWKYGYAVFMLLMLLIGSGMYIYMKRKRWF